MLELGAGTVVVDDGCSVGTSPLGDGVMTGAGAGVGLGVATGGAAATGADFVAVGVTGAGDWAGEGFLTGTVFAGNDEGDWVGFFCITAIGACVSLCAMVNAKTVPAPAKTMTSENSTTSLIRLFSLWSILKW